uniref:Uncharacterized protein n=1 Tax=Anguilla anguilla TaxID=7936 RepID=A0A0E9PU06_ANGAN
MNSALQVRSLREHISHAGVCAVRTFFVRLPDL